MTKKKVKKYNNNVCLDEDGETILIKLLREEFILHKFEDRSEIIRLNHSDGHHPFRVTIPMTEKKYWWPGMYRQVETELQKCDLCIGYGKQLRILKNWRVNPPSERPWVSISIDYLSLLLNDSTASPLCLLLHMWYEVCDETHTSPFLLGDERLGS
jgi:hypothetical protein